MSQEKKSIHIIGAGFSGLMTAFYLVRAGYKLTIFEEKSSVGGLLGTKKTPLGLVESGANAFIASKELEEVSQIIGAKLTEKNKPAKKRYIFRNGKPRRYPLSFLGTLRLIYFMVFIKYYKKSKENESLKDWGNRALGEEVTDYLLSPALLGVYAVEPEQLSAYLVLQSLFSEKQEKGVLKGSVCAVGGMGQWVSLMRSYLESQGCEIKFNSKEYDLKDTQPVVVATDFYSAKRFLTAKNLSKQMCFKKTESVSLTSVTLQFKKLKDSIVGFGCLFPVKENFSSLGVLFNHYIFKNRAVQGVVSETWILNDSKENISSMPESELIELILKDRVRLRGYKEIPLKYYIHQWPNKIPLYNLELERALQSNMEEKNLFLIGNYLGQLGLSKIMMLAKELSQTIEKRAVWEK